MNLLLACNLETEHRQVQETLFTYINKEVKLTGKDIDIICIYDPQQTDYQPEPSHGDPRGAASTAGTSYSARRPARGVRPLRQHLPRMYTGCLLHPTIIL